MFFLFAAKVNTLSELRINNYIETVTIVVILYPFKTKSITLFQSFYGQAFLQTFAYTT